MTDIEKTHSYPAGPLPQEGEALEARVRMKLYRGEPLTRREAEFFALMPADKQIPPEDVRRESRQHDAARQQARDLPPVEDEDARSP